VDGIVRGLDGGFGGGGAGAGAAERVAGLGAYRGLVCGLIAPPPGAGVVATALAGAARLRPDASGGLPVSAESYDAHGAELGPERDAHLVPPSRSRGL
jgi:hypothetical protein